MSSNIELKLVAFGQSGVDRHIHFNTISEVDAYLSKQPTEWFTTDGYFSIAHCRIEEEDAILALLDVYEARANAISSIRSNIAATTKLLTVSKEWVEFYEAVKAGDPKIIEQYQQHVELIREVSAQIDELQRSCNAFTSLTLLNN